MAIIFSIGSYDNTIQSAYNIIEYIAEDDGTTGTPPIVYCDIYFNATFYKTLASSNVNLLFGSATLTKFDISGVAREYFGNKAPNICGTGLDIEYTPPGFAGYGSANNYGMVQAYVKFRTSTIDSYGVVTPGGIAPVQATVDSPAVAGDGYQTDTFYIVNAALQVTDQSDLETQLQAFRNVGSVFATLDPSNRVYPLSYSKDVKIMANDWAVLPIITCENAFADSFGLYQASTTVKIAVAMFSGPVTAPTLIFQTTTAPIAIQDRSIYMIPVGMQNLKLLFGGFSAHIAACSFYFVWLQDPTWGAKFISPFYFPQKGDNDTQGYYTLYNAALNVTSVIPKHTRLWFQNFLGHYDPINFIEREETLPVTSTPTESLVQNIQSGYQRSQISAGRNNVRGADNNVITGLFNEAHMPFIKQLILSNKVYIEFVNPDGVGSIDFPFAVMLPVVITDQEITTLTYDDRYEYMVSIKYVMSNEYKVTR